MKITFKFIVPLVLAYLALGITLGTNVPVISRAFASQQDVQAIEQPAPNTRQVWVCWHHESQGQGQPSWTKWIPDDAVSGHNGHDDDGYADGCGPYPGDLPPPPPPPPPPPGCPHNVAPTLTPTPAPNNPPGYGVQYEGTNRGVVGDFQRAVEIYAAENGDPKSGKKPYLLIKLRTNPDGSKQALNGMDIPGGGPYALPVKGTTFCSGTGPGNWTGHWYYATVWKADLGWKILFRFRSDKCVPDDSLKFWVDANGNLEAVWNFHDWIIEKNPDDLIVVVDR